MRGELAQPGENKLLHLSHADSGSEPSVGPSPTSDSSVTETSKFGTQSKLTASTGRTIETISLSPDQIQHLFEV